MRSLLGFILLAGVSLASIQEPLSTSQFQDTETDEYQFSWPIRRVAVIGAGPSGLVAYRELTQAGLEVRIFERDSVPGGNWHYTEEIPLNAPVPNAPASIGSFVPSLPPPDVKLPYSEEFEDDGEIWRDHRGVKSMWESLTTNTPALLQQLPQWPWPVGTPWELTHYQLRNYIRSFASYINVNSNDDNPATAYNTRVERAEKRVNEAGEEQGWRLWLRSLEPTGHNMYRATWWTEDFDAVVVATSRYAPSVPSIPGLEEWSKKFPNLVRHSRQYRRPEPYTNQTVLIIGASASGSEISRDLNHHATKVYQSFRPQSSNRTLIRLETYLSRIPKNTTFVGEIERFLPIPEGSSIRSGLVELKNGTVLSEIDSVILATGYRFSFPFLSQYYDGEMYRPHEDSAATVSPFFPSDGSHIRELYLNQFYIRDPTLAFLSVSLGSPAFLFSEYSSLALAKVWSNTARLPSSRTMWAWYNKNLEEHGGYSKYLLLLSTNEIFARLGHLIGWLNSAASKYGGKQVDGWPKDLPEVFYYWQFAHFGGLVQVNGSREHDAALMSLGVIPQNCVDYGKYSHVFFDDNW